MIFSINFRIKNFLSKFGEGTVNLGLAKAELIYSIYQRD
jgi:hypothetical protein